MSPRGPLGSPQPRSPLGPLGNPVLRNEALNDEFDFQVHLQDGYESDRWSTPIGAFMSREGTPQNLNNSPAAEALNSQDNVSDQNVPLDFFADGEGFVDLNFEESEEVQEFVPIEPLNPGSLEWTIYWLEKRFPQAPQPPQLIDQVNLWREQIGLIPLTQQQINNALAGDAISDESVTWTLRFLDIEPEWEFNANELDYSTPIARSETPYGRVGKILKKGLNLRGNFKGTYRSNHKSAKNNPKIVSGIVDRLLLDGIISKGTPKAIHPLGLVKKNDGSPRLIHDLRLLNSQLPYIPARYPRMSDTFSKFEQTKASWFAKIDLKNGYFHIPVHKDFAKNLGFKWDKKSYYFNRLPFGLSVAPAIFQAISHRIVKEWSQNVQVYLDDFLIFGNSFQKVKDITDKIVQKLHKLHWRVNYKKSLLSPVQSLDFLGFSLNGQKMKWSFSEKFKVVLKLALENWEMIKSSEILSQKIFGFFSFMISPMKLGYSFMIEVLKTGQILNLLTWLISSPGFSWKKRKKRINEPSFLYVDATNFYIGLFPPAKTIELPCFTRIFEAEAIAVFLGILRFPDVIYSDNQSVIASFKKGSSKNSLVNSIIQLSAKFSLIHNFKLNIKWVPSESNLSDQFSRPKIEDLRTPLYKECGFTLENQKFSVPPLPFDTRLKSPLDLFDDVSMDNENELFVI